MLLRLCSMSRSRWPIHSVLDGTFGGFLSRNALFLCQDFIGLFIYRIGPFCVYYDFWFCVFMRFLCLWMCMPLLLCVSWAFSLPPPKFVCSVLFVWFDCFHYLLSLLLLFILDVCILMRERNKDCIFVWVRVWGGSGRIWGAKVRIRKHSMKKFYFK